MKKLLLTTLAILLSLSLFGRSKEGVENPAIIDERVTDWVLDQFRDAGYTVLPEVIVQDTLNKNKQNFSSRYETKGGRGMKMPKWANDSTWSPGQKQPQEFDDLYYLPSKDGKQTKHQKRQNIDAIVDTLVKENPDIDVTYEYNSYDPFFYSHNISRFYHGGFNYWMYDNPWYYNNYWMYDSFDWYWDMRFTGYPYWMYNNPWNNPWNYPYYNSFYFGYNNYWHMPYYYNNNYWRGGHNNFYGDNRSKQDAQYGRRERPSSLSTTHSSSITSQQRRVASPQQRNVYPENKSIYNETRRSYQPSYNNPRMNTRPQYNNSKINNIDDRRTQTSTQSRTYTTPSRSYNATPSRSYNSGSSNFNGDANRRNSSTSGFSTGSDGGRSSGSSNFSSGSNSGGRSSSGSNSSGSSGGSSTGRR
jgi:hypothetical protein